MVRLSSFDNAKSRFSESESSLLNFSLSSLSFGITQPSLVLHSLLRQLNLAERKRFRGRKNIGPDIREFFGRRTRRGVNPSFLTQRYYIPFRPFREQVREVRRAQGMQPNPKNMLAQWVYRGFVRHDEERGVYVKLKVEN